MKVIIPVAGIGKRLRPHTDHLPKPLLTVAGEAILDHVLKPLKALDVEELILIIGYKGEMIREYVGKNYDFKTRFVEQKELLGLGYAINLAVRELSDGPILVILGDTIVECDLADFVNSGDYVLAVRHVPDPERFGIVEIADGRIVGLEEKPKDPKTDLALIGLYYFSDSAMLRQLLDRHIDSGNLTSGEIQFTDALQHMIEAGISFVPHEVTGWYDCGTVSTLIDANREFIARIKQPTATNGCCYVEPVMVAESATVHNSIIGPNVTIESGATVEHSVLKDCIVNREAVVSNIVASDSIFGSASRCRGETHSINLGQGEQLTVERNRPGK